MKTRIISISWKFTIDFEHWRDLKAGKVSRAELRKRMAPLCPEVELALERAVAAGIEEASGSCADILEHRLMGGVRE